MEKVYIVGAKRSAVGAFLGGLSTLSPGKLGAMVAKDLLKEAKISGDAIDEVIVGNILSAGQKQGVGRQVSILAGIPQEVPAWSMNILCGSGLKSVMTAAQMIQSGTHHLILAGGTESMSQAPYTVPANTRTGAKMGNLTMVDTMINDALTDAFHDIHMGITAENIAAKYNISRQEQDAFAFESQQRAIKACDAGKFTSQITPIEIVSKKETILFAKDEYINRKTTLDKLGQLRPAFKKDGSVTAGNASGINDGAAFMLVASESAVKKHNLTPLVEIVGMGTAGVDPQYMGLGPTPAIAKALNHSKLSLKEIDLIELNEAFAAQSLGVMRELIQEHGVDQAWLNERTNVNGGAIAIGHPVGASGARVLTTLIHEMIAGNKQHGLASLCIGGGMGVALIVKKV
ncbi:acetyl-CoA C-acetyltransferase [Entomospira culicis]|uniref:Acetyl-CoA C-acetyltransferase n=1 Tax=Entomospira culicis TaxID=2719989 RepID=A0A968KUC4_9SPIO|nr:acetyl-CoA C-acetyltransferase [Entomospira culicis]NIZ19195.1 acetyl-CoA C-acetyltransferase [Entomospira culicis]NIZ69409.1 acetyl-CoA C-acetyltransferase [Entomospira culicis]WDI36526.1 acetyl-CoA C-acetyltransferase [Entomospira culicis]WDI38152.1 acetyl-CoA C-acetyltransferase [Entomospira culicis]